MLFIFLHEIGHLVTGIALGLMPKSLSITPFGLTVVFEAFSKRKRVEFKKILIAVAGPLVNLIICVITVFLNINEEIRQTIIYSNVLIFVFNLIPLYPLDGGRIIKSILRMKYNDVTVDRVIHKMSNVMTIMITIVSSILIWYYKNIAFLFLIIYLWVIVRRENRGYRIKKRVKEILAAIK
jgi:stage IV sporulation protein FB